MVSNKIIELNELRRNFSHNKVFPKNYEYVILKALSHFPELKEIHIHFELTRKGAIPYGTTTGFLSVIKRPAKRKYTITILEDADPPMELALFKNLPQNAQIGRLGHELAHVLQFNSCTRLQVLKNCLVHLKPSVKKKLKRATDILAIKHGLGAELYAYTSFIRTIPGYLKRKETDKNYLNPAEVFYRSEK